MTFCTLMNHAPICLPNPMTHATVCSPHLENKILRINKHEMGAYKYFCCARDFGCDVTRTRGTSIKKHELKCPVVKKFEKYIKLEKENKHLRAEVKRLTAIKGRKPVKIWNVNIREFANRFPKDPLLVAAWSKLSQGRLQNAVPALVKLFLASVPRFWKIAPCFKLVEVCGNFEEIRTEGEIHVVEMSELAQAIYFVMADNIIDSNMNVLDIRRSESNLEKLRMEFYTYGVGNDKKAIAFFRNALIDEVRRRRDHKPVKMGSVEVDLRPAKIKKSRAEAPGGVMTL